MDLPADVERVVAAYRTCEFVTLARDGTPIGWPTVSYYDRDRGRFLIATSVGMPQKAFNVRRNAHVSLLFSDPTGSGMEHPPAVLIQGDAEARDEIVTWSDELHPLARRIFERQPAGRLYSRFRVLRYLFDWYYFRLPIFIEPRRILIWEGGDFSRVPAEVEVGTGVG